jgi:hypothetical protein
MVVGGGGLSLLHQVLLEIIFFVMLLPIFSSGPSEKRTMAWYSKMLTTSSLSYVWGADKLLLFAP